MRPELAPTDSLLLSEVYRRTANAFEIVSAMMSRNILEGASPEAIFALRKADAQLKAFSVLNQMLHDRSEVVGYAGEICAAAYLKRLCVELQSACLTPQGVQLSVAAPEPRYLPDTVCRHLGLITTELVLNAAKHAFGDRADGKVGVLFATGPSDSRLHLVVFDDGCGMGADLDPQKQRGLKLVSLLAEAIGAECHGVSGPRGTAISVDLPLVADPDEPSPSRSFSVIWEADNDS